ncbi:nucleotidyl transferase AbiEii/AbiGii toxin family protein [candidate division WWE3 bacterium]|nr:nucleotidyl transferase AbiEii/AbiGii toxin family protein [candidate division WWE3 bacterium]
MLTLKQIKQHYNEKEQKLGRALLREYLQYQILDLIFSSFLGDKLVFTGGTAIRIVYGSDRFSEDLDFDVTGLNEQMFERFTQYLKRELKKRGLVSEYRNVHKGVYRCYLRFPNLLYDYKLSDQITEKILIQLDVAEKRKLPPVRMHLLNEFDVFKEIRTYPQEVLAIKKFEALLGRKRPKGRDIYDIVYLFSRISAEDLDFSVMESSYEVKSLQDLKGALKGFVERVNLKDLARDVEPFLIDPKKISRVLLFDRFVEELE